MVAARTCSKTDPAAADRHDVKPADRESVIQVEDLRIEYDGRTILEKINFEVQRHEVLVIAGESGSGKSALLRHMIGLETPCRGRVVIDGQDIAQAEGDDRRRILKKIGVAYQSGALFGSLSVLENVKLPIETYTRLPGRMADMLALTKLQLVEMASAAQKQPSELSGGMRKRAAIARALALDPAILFLDEPSAGLDPFTSAELDQLILTLRKLLDMTFVIVSHQLPSIFAIADRVLLLNTEKKTIVAEGGPKELKESSPDPWIRAFFNREPPHHEGTSEQMPKQGPASGRESSLHPVGGGQS